jgi:hypothetical protein
MPGLCLALACSGGFEEQARVRMEKETTTWKKSRRQEKKKNAANLCRFTDASLIRILCPEPLRASQTGKLGCRDSLLLRERSSKEEVKPERCESLFLKTPGVYGGRVYCMRISIDCTLEDSRQWAVKARRQPRHKNVLTAFSLNRPLSTALYCCGQRCWR